MKTISIKISSENEAFTECSENEIKRILLDIANNLRKYKDRSKILDINGNTCGTIEIE